MATPYTKLFMAYLEKDLMFTSSTKPKFWWQNINNKFNIWKHSQQSLKLFRQKISLFHTTIIFTAETSMERVTFLDTTVTLKNDMLHTDLYTKPTKTNQYLSPNSCHPKHCAT